MAEYSKTSKGYYIRRLGLLDIERSSFISHWRELSEFIDPRRGRFFVNDRNKGERRHTKIINSRGTQALRTSQSGIFAGTMSPTQPTFKFDPMNLELLESFQVRKWLYDVENLIRTVLLDGNFYSEAPVTIGESLEFATGAMSQVDDYDSVARFCSHTAGSYWIGTNYRGEVDTFVEQRDWQVSQIVQEFGLENCTKAVQDLWNRGTYDTWFSVVQFIEPNPEADPTNPGSSKKPFISVWFEYGPSVNSSYASTSSSNSVVTDEKFLRKGGFDEFPVHVLRWATTYGDVYGTNCPGMVALGDIKALQIMEKRKAQAVDKLVNPPLKGPPTLANVPVSSLPGGLTIYDNSNDKEGLTAVYTVDPRINELRADMQDIERRINEAFFVDLFQAISTMEGVQPRNQLELTQRNQERLLMLGPPLQRIQQEFLSKVIERTFKQCSRAGILPESPPELQGQALNLRFISALAQAQRAAETGVIERVAMFVGGLAPLDPQIVDKVNFDEMVDQYARNVGAMPSIIVPQEQVDQVRQQRQQQQMQMQQAAQAEQVAGAAQAGTGAVKNLAEAENAGQ